MGETVHPRSTRKWAWLLAMIVIAVALAAVAFFVMNSNRDYTIEFIIPNDYHGVIIAEQDKDHGAEPAIKDGNIYVYTVPETGTLLVKSFDLFERYHFTVAQYADGRAIPTSTSGGKGPMANKLDEVALRDVGSQVKGKEKPKHFMCVGNLDDYRTCRKQYGFE